MESDTLHSTKNHVLGNLDTEAVEARDEDVCLLHPLHGLLAQDKQLSADMVSLLDGFSVLSGKS